MTIDSNSMVLGAGIGAMVTAGAANIGLGWAIGFAAAGTVLAVIGYLGTQKEVHA